MNWVQCIVIQFYYNGFNELHVKYVMDRLQTNGELQDRQVLLIHQLVLIC
jgi:hypothetical protein